MSLWQRTWIPFGEFAPVRTSRWIWISGSLCGKKIRALTNLAAPFSRVNLWESLSKGACKNTSVWLLASRRYLASVFPVNSNALAAPTRQTATRGPVKASEGATAVKLDPVSKSCDWLQRTEHFSKIYQSRIIPLPLLIWILQNKVDSISEGSWILELQTAKK